MKTSSVRSVGFVAAFLLMSCAGDPVPITACTAGVQTACACTGGATGSQRCAADGSGFGACDCPDAATPMDASRADALVADAASDNPSADVVVPIVCDGTTCPVVPHSVPRCVDGTSCSADCDFYFSNCDRDETNGCETDVRTPQNCGRCGRVCTGSTSHCVNGMCAP